MRDAVVYIDEHPFKGEVVSVNGENLVVGKIWCVEGNRRLYIQMLRGGTEINYPLYEIAKILFDE